MENNLTVIADTIKQSFGDREIRVEVEIQSATELSVKLRSSQSLGAQKSIEDIAQSLNSIEVYYINHVKISRISARDNNNPVWNGYLNIVNGRFIAEPIVLSKTASSPTLQSSQGTKPTGLVYGVIAVGLVVSIFQQKPNSSKSPIAPITPIVTSSPDSSPGVFMGKSQSGYELWLKDKCIHVKGATNADFARLNTDLWGFKEAIKKETGTTSVLFE